MRAICIHAAAAGKLTMCYWAHVRCICLLLYHKQDTNMQIDTVLV